MLTFRSLALIPWLLFAPLAGAWGTDLLVAPAATFGGAVESAGLLRDALEARGREVVESPTLVGANLAAYEAVWICLGVYPFTHPLTFAEGVALKEHLEAGGTVYLEGGDVWGYDVLTPLNTIDGITASADGGNDLFAIEGLVGEHGVDFSAFAALYSGENTNLDRIYADLPGAMPVLSKAGGAYDVGVLHRGSHSGLADFRFLGVTFEFGGVASDRDALLEEFLIALDLEADCRLDAPTAPQCTYENQRVAIAWQNLAPYESIEIVRDEEVIALLSPTANTYVDLAPPGGHRAYLVRARGGEECSWESEVCFVEVPIEEQFRRGDTNHDARIDIIDAIDLLRALFVPDSFLACPDAGDINDSGTHDIADAIILLRHVFESGPPPSFPGTDCGIDPTTDNFGACDALCAP